MRAVLQPGCLLTFLKSACFALKQQIALELIQIPSFISVAGSSTSGPMDIQSIRERTIAENSLVILLQGLQGQVTTVDLRDESTARGRVVNVDAFMNVRLEEVLYRDRRGRLSQLTDIFITGRNIRYVHIPDQVNIVETIGTQLARIQRVRNFAGRGGGRREYAKNKK